MERQQQPAQQARSPRLFIIDDEQSIRTAIVRFLRRRGWVIEQAEDGRVALEMLLHSEPNRYDAVLCDLRMPNVSGEDLYRELLEKRPDLAQRLIFSSGDISSTDAADFLARSKRPVIEKPFELTRLEELVNQVLARTRTASGGPPDAP